MKNTNNLMQYKRNNNDYCAKTADEAASQRRTKASTKTKLSAKFIAIIEEKLQATWSPEQISNTVLKGIVSFKSIYRWIYAGKIDTDNLALLRHKGRKRKGAEKRGIFSNGVSISERSEQANNRTEFGHWELDSMVSSRGESKGVFSTFIERKSRLYTAFVGKDRTADTKEQAICKLYKALPKGAFKSATSDRGRYCQVKFAKRLCKIKKSKRRFSQFPALNFPGYMPLRMTSLPNIQ